MTFGKDIAPIFQKHNCFECHDSTITQKVKAGLDFQKPDTVKPLLDDGELVKRLKDMGEDRMPPEGKGDRLSPSEIEKVEAWVAWGGKF
jgi:mono/diheme cytochrome c family protein